MIDRIEREVDLLARHVDVLQRVIAAEPIGITALSAELGYPEHKVRYSLRKLERNDLVEPTKSGAVTTDRAESNLAELDRHFSALVSRLDRQREAFGRVRSEA